MLSICHVLGARSKRNNGVVMMDYEHLYFETGIPARPGYRKYFHGWKRAYQNAMWWAKPGNDVYISVYGFADLVFNGTSKGYKRTTLPDYKTAQVDKIFLDFDYFVPGTKKFREDAQLDALTVDEWLHKKDIRRRWVFSGGGYHCLIRAEGSADSVENAHFFLYAMLKDTQGIDEVTFDLERMRRLPGSYNKKRKAYCIPITIEELELPYNEIKKIANKPRRANYNKYTSGNETWFIDDVQSVHRESRTILGSYSRSVIQGDTQKVLDYYGIDFDTDFCHVMKHIITKDAPNNFERLQLIRYLKDVVGVPFVDVMDKHKTVMNLLYNLLHDKKKARHSNNAQEAKTIYQRNKKFHPYKLKKLGICPEDCKECLRRRTMNGN